MKKFFTLALASLMLLSCSKDSIWNAQEQGQTGKKRGRKPKTQQEPQKEVPVLPELEPSDASIEQRTDDFIPIEELPSNPSSLPAELLGKFDATKINESGDEQPKSEKLNKKNKNKKNNKKKKLKKSQNQRRLLQRKLLQKNQQKRKHHVHGLPPKSIQKMNLMK